MKLEAVITCVNYGDFLAYTLPINKSLFNRLVVVTSPEDKLTQRVCEYWHVQCIQTDVFRSKEGHFCKGAGINVGLAALDKDGWVMQLDGDIVLPPLTRLALERAALNPDTIYGADRFMVRNYQEWAEFLGNPRLLHENHSWIHLSAFPLGTRVAIDSYGGYIPIGFLQMWHPGASKISRYPEGHTNAAREDMMFTLTWPRARRALLPEIVAYHLESEQAPMGKNWDGRSTIPFGPTPPVPAKPFWLRVCERGKRFCSACFRKPYAG